MAVLWIPVIRTETARCSLTPRRLGPALRQCRREFRGILEIFRLQSGQLRNPREHSGTDLIIIVEGKHHIMPTGTFQCAVRARLTFDPPSNAAKRSQNSFGSCRGPLAHAALKVTWTRSELASLCSSCSARTRRASACPLAIASSRVWP